MGCISSASPPLQIKTLKNMRVHDSKFPQTSIDRFSYKNQSSDRFRDKNRRKINKVEFLDQGQTLETTENVTLSTDQFTVDDKEMLDGVLSKNYIFHKLSCIQRKQLINRFTLYDGCFDENNNNAASHTTLNKNSSYLFHKNDIGSLFFVIKKGTVEIEIENSENKGKISKKILTRGQSFGQIALLYKTFRTASAKCLQKCSFLCISSYIFRDALQNIVQKTIQSNKILIDRIKLFQYLSPKEKNRLANNVIILKYEKDDIIFRQGEESLAFLVVASGKVQIQIKEKAVIEFRPGDYFGESSFLDNAKRSGTAYSTEKTQLMLINKHTLKKVLGEQTQQFYFYSILKWSLKRNPIFNQLSANSLQKLLKQSDIICFEHDHQILKEGQKIRKIYIPIQGGINDFTMGQIINCQYLQEMQKDRKVLPLISSSLVKINEGHVCVIDISKIMSIFQKNSIEISKIDSKAFQQMKKSISSKKQLTSSRHKSNKKLLGQKSSNIKIQHLTMIKKIGDGQFGSIYKVRNILDNTVHALKAFKKSQVNSYRMRHFVKQQIEIMQMINLDKFIVEYQKHFQTDEYILILMQLIDGKDFFDTILEIGWLSTQLVQFFFATFVLALQYMHQNDIIYRDIKPENAVIQSTGYLKLIDLGTSRRLTSSTGYRSFTIIGTPHYMAPQVVAGKGYSFQADIWSLGILLYELACGTFPFGQKLQEPIQIYNQIIKPNLSIIYPKELKQKSLKRLIERLLIKEPSNREIENFNQIKESQFYQGFEWKKFEQKNMKSPFKPESKHHFEEDQKNNKKTNQETLINFLEKIKYRTLKQDPTTVFEHWDQI